MKLSKRTLTVAGGYALFMLIFFFLGVTKARFLDFVGIALLAAVYAGIAKLVTKIYEGSKKQ